MIGVTVIPIHAARTTDISAGGDAPTAGDCDEPGFAVGDQPLPAGFRRRRQAKPPRAEPLITRMIDDGSGTGAAS